MSEAQGREGQARGRAGPEVTQRGGGSRQQGLHQQRRHVVSPSLAGGEAAAAGAEERGSGAARSREERGAAPPQQAGAGLVLRCHVLHCAASGAKRVAHVQPRHQVARSRG